MTLAQPCLWKTLILLPLWAGPASTAGAQEATGGSKNSGEPYVLESIHSEYRFERDGTGRIEQAVRARIQSEAGVHQLGQLLHPYLGGRSRLELEELEVVRPDGSRLKGGPDQIRDLPAPVTAAFPMYSDLRVLHVTAPPLAPGDVLHYRLVDYLERPDAPGQIWMEHRFRKDAVVLLETAVLDVPATVELRLRTADGLTAETTTTGGRTRHTWTASSTEPGGSGSRGQVAQVFKVAPADVQASSFDDWDEVAAWMVHLWSERATPNERLRRKAKELLEGVEGGRPQVEALYGFVSSELRYLGLLLGLHRYQPLPASSVLDNGYGDCKDKHTLLAALLASAGYEADPVFVSVLREELAEDVPSPAQFDHVITAVNLDGETLWLDSTSQVAPFGYLPPAIRGKKGLRVASGGHSAIVSLPESLPWPAEDQLVVEGVVDADGTLRVDVRQSSRGDSEFLLRVGALNLGTAYQKQVFERVAREFGDGAEIRDLALGNPTEVEEPFTIRFGLEIPDFLVMESSVERLRSVLPRLRLPSFDSAEEGDPLAMGERRRIVNRLELTLPEGVEAQAAPVPVRVEREFADFRSTYEVEGSRLTVERELNVRTREVPSAERGRYEALVRTVASDFAQTFELELGANRSGLADTADPDRLADAAARAAKADDHDRSTELYAKLVELEPEHPTAWNELGKALFELERYDESLAAFEKQLAIDPFHESVRSWIAHTHDELGDRDRAMAIYREQLVEFPLDGYAKRELGRLLVDAGECSEASPLLRDAIAIDGDNCTARRLLGTCQLGAGEIEQGVATLEHVSESCDDWNVYWAGRAAVDNGQSELGMRLYRQAAERGYAEAQTQLGWSYAGGRGVPRDDTLAMEWYRKAAAQNHARAVANIGWMYENGRGVEEDPVQAVAWYRRAAEADSAYAQMRLGRMYEYGNGVELDLATAADWYRRGAENGSSEAQARIGILLELGLGVEKSMVEAIEWYQMAAEAGDSLGQYRLGILYRWGTGVEEDHAVAAEWLTKAADQGHAGAQGVLGYMYERGLGVATDEALAAKLSLQAAEKGDSVAQFSVARYYMQGLGVEQNRARAVEWLTKAAEADQSAAQAWLGSLYQFGHGVDRDFEAAAKWFRRAAEQGDSGGQVGLGQLYAEGNGVEQSWDLALEWLTKAADQGNPTGQGILGDLYLTGRGVERDPVRAKELLTKAANQGVPPAQISLGWMLSNGVGAPEDPEAGYRWYEKAAESGFPPAIAAVGEALEWGRGVKKDPKAAVAKAREAAAKGDHQGQYNLGRYYLMGKGVEQDLVASYAWLMLASEDPRFAEDAREMMAELGLDEAQKTRAEKLAGSLRSPLPQ